MTDTPDAGESSGPDENVLRPFEPMDVEPLPPVEPSKVVPEPPMSDDEAIDTIEALADEPFAPEPGGLDDVWSADSADAPVVPAPPVSDLSADDLTDPLADADDDPADHIDAEVAGELPVAGAASDTITLSRTTFQIGLGVMAVVLLALVVLWQTAGDDGDTAVVAEPASAEASDEAPAADEDADEAVRAPTDTDPAVPDLSEELAQARAEVAGLEAVVDDLSTRPPAAIDGNSMRRIVTGSEVNFVSASSGSVAVIGSFGGLSMIDPEQNRVVFNVDVGSSANRVMRTDSSVWITDYQGSRIIQVDPGTDSVKAVFPFPGPDGIAKVDDALVVASFDGGYVSRINPTTGEELQRLDVGDRPSDVFFDEKGLWVALFDSGEIVRIDVDEFSVADRVQTGANPVGITAGPGRLWVANNGEGTISKVNPDTLEVELTVVVGEGPADIAIAAGAAWVTVSDDGTLVQVDVSTGEIVTVTPLGGAIAGGGPTGIDVAGGALWVAMQGEQSVVKIEI
ncbi:MAG: hypothetical protein AAF548_11450 [Actinomycetota bacterium]